MPESPTLSQAEAAGISFVVPLPVAHGWSEVYLNLSEAERFTKVGSDQFWAEYFRVSLNQFRAWVNGVHCGACNAPTKDGKPCGIRSNPRREVECSPVDFQVGLDDFCKLHQERARRSSIQEHKEPRAG